MIKCIQRRILQDNKDTMLSSWQGGELVILLNLNSEWKIILNFMLLKDSED